MTWDHDAEHDYLEAKGAWGEQPDETSAPDPLAELVSLFAPLGPWVADAACAAPGVDPTIFDAPDADELAVPAPIRAARQRRALAVCQSCPVQRECRQDGEDNELVGIRGGVLYTKNRHGSKQYDLAAYAAAGLLDRPLGYGRAPTLPADAPSAA